MNGKKAKALRRLAGFKPNEPRKYFPVEHTIRSRAMENLAGEALRQWKTATFKIVSDEGGNDRVLYKLLKKAYRLGKVQ